MSRDAYVVGSITPSDLKRTFAAGRGAKDPIVLRAHLLAAVESARSFAEYRPSSQAQADVLLAESRLARFDAAHPHDSETNNDHPPEAA